MSWPNPVEGVITSSYGERINPVLKKAEFHDGIDIACPKGSNVISVSDGIVTDVGYSPTYGNYIKYLTAEGYKIMYAHLQQALVAVGDTVKQGEKIALSGSTGMVTGAHLHYAVWKEDLPTDPMLFVKLPYTDDVLAEYTSRAVNSKF